MLKKLDLLPKMPSFISSHKPLHQGMFPLLICLWYFWGLCKEWKRYSVSGMITGNNGLVKTKMAAAVTYFQLLYCTIIRQSDSGHLVFRLRFEPCTTQLSLPAQSCLVPRAFRITSEGRWPHICRVRNKSRRHFLSELLGMCRVWWFSEQVLMNWKLQSCEQS